MTILQEAKKPVLLAGGGGWTTIGRENLCRFAEKQNLPVVVGFRRQDFDGQQQFLLCGRSRGRDASAGSTNFG